MSDLNELLKQKAEKDLKADIEKYLQTITSHPLFSCLMNIMVPIGPEAKPVSMNSFFWGFKPYGSSEKDVARHLILNKYLDERIQENATQFLNKVEDLQMDLDNLRNEVARD